MIHTKTFVYFIALITILWGCQTKDEAQRPISYTSGSFIKNSVERNKLLYAEHERKFQEIFCNDSLRATHQTKSGFWYAFANQSETAFIPIQKGDVIYYNCEIRDIDNNLIYPIEKFKNQQYIFEKENIISGLREGFQLLKKDDIVDFYLPSQMAYGFHGDNDKIVTNTPLIIRVQINDIQYKSTPN